MGSGRAGNQHQTSAMVLATNSLYAALAKSEMDRYNAASFP